MRFLNLRKLMSRPEPSEEAGIDAPTRKTRSKPSVKRSKPRSQVGALPFQVDSEGHLRVMLITSRETRRWVIPKGWPMRGVKPHRAAEREAYEEAGLKGKVGKTAIGTYGYEKRLADGLTIPCEVSVFAFEVMSQRKRWPEMDQRDGRWFSPDEAADLVDEEELRLLLRGFSPAPAKVEKLKAEAPGKAKSSSGVKTKASGKPKAKRVQK